MPIFITIAARFYPREPITLRKIGGIILGFIGIALIISKRVFSLSIFHFGSTLGDFLVLISALTWTAFTVGGKGFLSRFSSLAAITPIMIVGCLITFPFVLYKMGMEYTLPFIFIWMDGHPIFGNLLFWSGLSFLVSDYGEKGFKHCGNVPLSGAFCNIDRSLLFLE